MSDQNTLITVQGQHMGWFAAERGTVSVSVGFDGPDRSPVFEATASAAAALTAELTGLHDPDAGPVTWWSSDQVRVWSDRPWNNEGKQLPPVFHAAVSISAKFRDFEALAAWVERIANVDGVTVGAIAWDLTDSRRVEVTDEVRRLAVADAVAKARVFAASLGAGEPVAVAIADPGMLGDTGGGAAGYERTGYAKSVSSPMMMRDAAGPALALTPEQIEVSASVDVRFRA